MSYISIDYNQASFKDTDEYNSEFTRYNELSRVDGPTTFDLTTPSGVDVTYDANVFRVDGHNGYFRVYYEISMDVYNELTALRIVQKAA